MEILAHLSFPWFLPAHTGTPCAGLNKFFLIVLLLNGRWPGEVGYGGAWGGFSLILLSQTHSCMALWECDSTCPTLEGFTRSTTSCISRFSTGKMIIEKIISVELFTHSLIRLILTESFYLVLCLVFHIIAFSFII